MIDLAVADAAVWVLTHAFWFCAVIAAFIVGAFCAPGYYRAAVRRLGDENDRLTAQLAEADVAAKHARYISVVERQNAAKAQQLAEHAASMLQAWHDGVACAEMELANDWEDQR